METITPPDNPTIELLDVEPTGDVALSLVALHFHRHSSFDAVEAPVNLALVDLIDGSGHRDYEIERKLTGVRACERLSKRLTPRNNADAWGHTALWAVKLLRKLGLEVASNDSEPG